MRLQCFCLSSNIIHCVVLQTPFFLPDRESSSWNAKEEKNGKIKGEDSHCSGPNTKVNRLLESCLAFWNSDFRSKYLCAYVPNLSNV